jgi:uncharacterized protein (DUF305 family)
MKMNTRAFTILLTAAALASACAGADDNEEAATTDTSSMMTDSAMAGMDHSQMMNQHGPAKDANHEFLRMMSDHHEGLVVIAAQAMDKGSAQETKSDAHELHTKQAAERDSMVAMIKRDYQEDHKPRPMAKNQAQADSLSAMSGAAYDRKFYAIVIEHHREGIRMMDEFLPRLTKPELKQMVEKMKSEQQREITKFQPKAGS